MTVAGAAGPESVCSSEADDRVDYINHQRAKPEVAFRTASAAERVPRSVSARVRRLIDVES